MLLQVSIVSNYSPGWKLVDEITHIFISGVWNFIIKKIPQAYFLKRDTEVV